MAIVYAPTRGSTEAVARALCKAGHRAAPYHAGLSKTTRAATLDNFLRDRVDVIVATCAFGMGIDKPSVRLVVHWTAAHAGGLLPGGGTSGTGWRVRPLRAAVAAGRRRPPPPPARCHVPGPPAAGADLVRAGWPGRRSRQRAGIGRAAAAGAAPRAGAG